MRKFIFLYNNDAFYYFTIIRMILHLIENAVYEYSSKVFKQTHILSNSYFLVSS